MPFEDGLIGCPYVWNAGRPEGSISPLEEKRAVDLPAAWISRIDGSALGFEQRVNVRFHGCGQTEPRHERIEFLDDVVGFRTMKMLNGKRDLHFAVSGFDTPALFVASDNGLGRHHCRIEQGGGDDHEFATLTFLGPPARK